MYNGILFSLKKEEYTGTSLAVQWLRLCLPIPGMRFDPWSES